MESEVLRDLASQEIVKIMDILVRSLVDNPGQVYVRHKNGEQTTQFFVKVAKEDMGKVIGKEGRNANALRELLKNICAKRRMRGVLEIEE